MAGNFKAKLIFKSILSFIIIKLYKILTIKFVHETNQLPEGNHLVICPTKSIYLHCAVLTNKKLKYICRQNTLNS
ncbi:MAG TPA: hypothetical protein DCF33_15115 [Saprospirales bacterium]|nr:hypothetical protein [Saprospirales bacterium]